VFQWPLSNSTPPPPFQISLLNTQIKTEQTTVKGLEEELKERGERPQSPEIDELKANLSKEKEEVCHLKQQIMEKDTRIRELMKQLENKEKILADDERAPEVGDNRHSRKTSTKIAEAMKRFSSTGALVGNEEKTKVTKTTKPKATAKPVQSDRTRPTSGKDSTHSQRPTSGKIKTTTTTTTSVRSVVAIFL
jgi:vacuolar-type H+-ATPase subunit I/STV1